MEIDFIETKLKSRSVGYFLQDTFAKYMVVCVSPSLNRLNCSSYDEKLGEIPALFWAQLHPQSSVLSANSFSRKSSHFPTKEGRKEGGGDEKNTPGEIRPGNRITKRVFAARQAVLVKSSSFACSSFHQT